jgi:hypothetical protein
MITELLLTLVVGIMVGLDQLIPDLALGDGIGESVGAFTSQMLVLSNYVPLIDLWAAVLTLALLRLGMSAWHLIVWLYHQFWGSE